jgi:hypothetical protein
MGTPQRRLLAMAKYCVYMAQHGYSGLKQRLAILGFAAPLTWARRADGQSKTLAVALRPGQPADLMELPATTCRSGWWYGCSWDDFWPLVESLTQAGLMLRVNTLEEG